MEATDENDASTVMMPTLPDPWEGLVTRALHWAREDGMGTLGPCPLASNYAAFEAERALRVALGDLLRDKWFLNGRDSDS